MPWELLMRIIAIIRKEQKERMEALTPDEEDSTSEFADDAAAAAYLAWNQEERPLINELCLMLLVTLWHHVQRELIWIAALATDKEGEIIEEQRWEERAKELSEPAEWRTVKKTLRLPCKPTKKDPRELEGEWERQRREEWYKPIEILELLANSYKHDPSVKAQEKLIKFLDLDRNTRYAPLWQSTRLQEELASEVGLEKNAAYCDIAERFVEKARDFLVIVMNRNRGTLREVKRRLPNLLDLAELEY